MATSEKSSAQSWLLLEDSPAAFSWAIAAGLLADRTAGACEPPAVKPRPPSPLPAWGTSFQEPEPPLENMLCINAHWKIIILKRKTLHLSWKFNRGRQAGCVDLVFVFQNL